MWIRCCTWRARCSIRPYRPATASHATLSLPTCPVDPTACTTQSQATLARREHAHRCVPCLSQHDDAGYVSGYVTLAMSQPQRRAPARKDKQRPIYTRGISRYTALRILPTPLRASTWQLRKHRHPPPVGPHGAGHHADGLWYPANVGAAHIPPLHGSRPPQPM
jgi:hypothetical protein